MALFNVLFTSLLPFIIGIFEKDVAEEILEEVSGFFSAIVHSFS